MRMQFCFCQCIYIHLHLYSSKGEYLIQNQNNSTDVRAAVEGNLGILINIKMYYCYCNLDFCLPTSFAKQLL